MLKARQIAISKTLPVSSVFKTLVAASVDALTSVMDIFNMDTDRM